MLLDTPVCNLGWKAAEFTLCDPDGQTFRMSDYLGEKPLLIAFLCNHCPYVRAIAERLAEDTADLMAEGIGVLGVMSNDYAEYPADSPPEMKRFAAAHGWAFPYLVDEAQTVGKIYGAVCTPDFFGFNADGELQYRGRLDDAGRGDAHGRTRELVEAMRQIATKGTGPQDQVPSLGCSIKWT
ncbi:redoxin domain-containing protein [Algicella marina]|uniref:Redoxin domain-containing protein n=2 Tax=Algicella marina TaxID=2683284 RepID=A0A6P1T3N8_9RHOB|nr:redoxin domain-containing protein [Algicella marina]